MFDRFKDFLDRIVGQIEILLISALVVAYWKTGGDVSFLNFTSAAWDLYETAINSPVTQVGVLIVIVFGVAKLAAGIAKDMVDAAKKFGTLIAVILVLAHVLTRFNAIAFLEFFVEILSVS